MDAAGVDLLVIAAYLSLVLELWLIPVPSVASARSLSRASREVSPARRALPGALRRYAPVVLNIAVFLLPLLGALHDLLTDSTAPRDSSLVSAGILAVLSGRTLTVCSALALRSQVRLAVAEGTLDPPLHTTGVFRLSRNPGLLGMYLFAAGLLALKPSAWFALGLLHYAWHMHRCILIEERHLAAEFGKAYDEYMSRTRRYV